MGNRYDEIIEEIYGEVTTAALVHPPMASLHEAYAVLLEEVDELWEEVKKNPRKHPMCRERARKEAIQVAAMAIRMLNDVL